MSFCKKLTLLILLSVMSLFAMAQADSTKSCICPEYCCSMDPTPSGVMLSHIHKKKQWMLSYRYMTMEMGSMQDGTEKVADSYVFQDYLMTSNKMKMDMHMLMAMYGLSEKLTLMAMFNYNILSMKMQMLPGSTHHMNGMDMSADATDMNMKTTGISLTRLRTSQGTSNQKIISAKDIAIIHYPK